jgi:hypothetical protein
MFGYRRRRSPLIWRLLKAAAAGGALYLMIREPDPERRRARRAARSRATLVANAERALKMKMRSPKPWRPESRTPGAGMRSIANEDIAPSGAIEAEGFRPAFERSHRAR